MPNLAKAVAEGNDAGRQPHINLEVSWWLHKGHESNTRVNVVQWPAQQTTRRQEQHSCIVHDVGS